MKKIFSLLYALLVPILLNAQGSFVSVSPSIRYQLIGTYDIARLNNILKKEMPDFIESNVTFTDPKNAVKLYRVEYTSVIPEQGNRPTIASGLIAIPATGAKMMPMVSYQHGTLYDRDAVPSNPDKSNETRLMIAQFAAQGYVVIGADYFGLGSSKEKDSYIVVDCQVQASYDMYQAALTILAKEGIGVSNFFLTGWSQGGVITMAYLEKLESYRIKVKAVGTSAAQCDAYVMTNGFLQHPRSIDAPWVSTMFILTAFAFEEYYQMPGLARGLFTEEQYPIAKRVYEHDPTLTYDKYPFDLKKLIRPEYFDPVYYRQSAYGQLTLKVHPYRWMIETPVKMCYGDVDECLAIGLARLPSEFQKATGNNNVEAISMGKDANHRIAYGRAVSVWKSWFDEMLKK